MLVAFMPWNGYNFEDSILHLRSAGREDRYTSITSRNCQWWHATPNSGRKNHSRYLQPVERMLGRLDESGIVPHRCGSGSGRCVGGQGNAKGETQLTPEEKLLRAIFGRRLRM